METALTFALVVIGIGITLFVVWWIFAPDLDD